MSLISTDRLAYEGGDTVIYEVQVENTGTSALVLPWSPDLARVLSATSTSGSIFLEVRNASGQPLGWLTHQTLYGSSEVDGTLQTLEPGENALLRLRGEWVMGADEWSKVLTQSQSNVSVAAVLRLAGSRGVVASENTIPITVSNVACQRPRSVGHLTLNHSSRCWAWSDYPPSLSVIKKSRERGLTAGA